jgi:diphthamide synthase (EF-2-diphthine--ammonia ligase)
MSPWDTVLDLLGKPFDLHAIDVMVAHGVDACGEAGEFHTVVTAGPLFNRPLQLRFGEPVLRDGYWFVDCSVRP